MTSMPDELAAASHDLALAALYEITAESTVGPPAGYTAEGDGVVSLRFENRLPGYPGWYWTVTVAQVDDAEPTVLEAELLPGDGALLAPDWVPWAERLAEYRAHQAELAEQAAQEQRDADAPDDEDDDLDEDEDDDVDLGDDDLDLGDDDLDLGDDDLDGVDIDELVADDDLDPDDDEDDDSADSEDE